MPEKFSEALYAASLSSLLLNAFYCSSVSFYFFGSCWGGLISFVIWFSHCSIMFLSCCVESNYCKWISRPACSHSFWTYLCRTKLGRRSLAIQSWENARSRCVFCKIFSILWGFQVPSYLAITNQELVARLVLRPWRWRGQTQSLLRNSGWRLGTLPCHHWKIGIYPGAWVPPFRPCKLLISLAGTRRL